MTTRRLSMLLIFHLRVAIWIATMYIEDKAFFLINHEISTSCAELHSPASHIYILSLVILITRKPISSYCPHQVTKSLTKMHYAYIFRYRNQCNDLRWLRNLIFFITVVISYNRNWESFYHNQSHTTYKSLVRFTSTKFSNRPHLAHITILFQNPK